MNFRILGSIALRYFWLYTRHPVRIVELLFWPFMQLLVWGFLTKYLQSESGGDFPATITYLIGAIITVLMAMLVRHAMRTPDLADRED